MSDLKLPLKDKNGANILHETFYTVLSDVKYGSYIADLSWGNEKAREDFYRAMANAAGYVYDRMKKGLTSYSPWFCLELGVSDYMLPWITPQIFHKVFDDEKFGVLVVLDSLPFVTDASFVILNYRENCNVFQADLVLYVKWQISELPSHVPPVPPKVKI